MLLIVFLFLGRDLCCSTLFVLGGGSVLFIVFCFGRRIRVAPRFLF